LPSGLVLASEMRRPRVRRSEGREPSWMLPELPPSQRFRIEAWTKGLGRLNRTHIGGRVLVPEGYPFSSRRVWVNTQPILVHGFWLSRPYRAVLPSRGGPPVRRCHQWRCTGSVLSAVEEPACRTRSPFAHVGRELRSAPPMALRFVPPAWSVRPPQPVLPCPRALARRALGPPPYPLSGAPRD